MWNYFIMRDILWRRKSKAISLYQQLMLGMSAFLLFDSLAWALAAYPVPTVTQNGEPTGIRNAHGNQATCTAQAFTVQRYSPSSQPVTQWTISTENRSVPLVVFRREVLLAPRWPKETAHETAGDVVDVEKATRTMVEASLNWQIAVALRVAPFEEELPS
jgi:hypothetical protein